MELKIIDKIIAENDLLVDGLRSQLITSLEQYSAMSTEELTAQRYNRFRII
jgi:acetyl-CoA carboxylase alpha subunit